MQNSEFAHDPKSFAPLANVAKNALEKKNTKNLPNLHCFAAHKCLENQRNQVQFSKTTNQRGVNCRRGDGSL